MRVLDVGPGKVVAGRYQLERVLGEGGMGVVWSATSLDSGRSVALKILKAISPHAVRRFRREARLAAAVCHPNIVSVHEIVQLDDGAPVLVMERLTGETLGTRLTRDGTLSLPELSRILVPVVCALGAAHALGIVHRDLKPDNIFLCGASPDLGQVKVLDFGIAKLAAPWLLAESGRLTFTGSTLGTPYYMAPEQVFGQRDIDHRADIWALGAIGYEALSGRRPIDGRNVGHIFRRIVTGRIVPLEELVLGLPADVTRLVARMLSRDRERRPADLREPLDVLVRHASVRVPGFRAPRRGATPPRGRSWAVALGLTASGVAATLGAATVRFEGRPAPPIARLLPRGEVRPDASIMWAVPPAPSRAPAADSVSSATRPDIVDRPSPARSAPIRLDRIDAGAPEQVPEPLPGGVHAVSPY